MGNQNETKTKDTAALQRILRKSATVGKIAVVKEVVSYNEEFIKCILNEVASVEKLDLNVELQFAVGAQGARYCYVIGRSK